MMMMMIKIHIRSIFCRLRYLNREGGFVLITRKYMDSAKPRLSISYRCPQRASEGVRRELRLLRTHLSQEFDLHLIANDDGPSLPFDIWIDIVTLLLEKEPTPENAIRLMRLSATNRELSAIFRDPDGALERSVNRRFFGGRIHETTREQRQLGREKSADVRYAWIFGPEFLNLSEARISTLVDTIEGNRRRRKGEPINAWPWWYFRFVSNWRVRRNILESNFRVEERPDFAPLSIFVDVPGKRFALGGPAQGADLLALDMKELVGLIADRVQPGDRHVSFTIMMNFHHRGSWRHEFELYNIQDAVDVGKALGIDVLFNTLLLEGTFLRSGFVPRLTAPATITKLTLRHSSVSGRKLDLSAVRPMNIEVKTVDVDSVSLSCADFSILVLDNDTPGTKTWRPFDADPTCFRHVHTMNIRGNVATGRRFLLALQKMVSLKQLFVEDPSIEWERIARAIDRTSTESSVMVSLNYSDHKAPFAHGTTKQRGRVFVHFFKH